MRTLGIDTDVAAAFWQHNVQGELLCPGMSNTPSVTENTTSSSERGTGMQRYVHSIGDTLKWGKGHQATRPPESSVLGED